MNRPATNLDLTVANLSLMKRSGGTVLDGVALRESEPHAHHPLLLFLFHPRRIVRIAIVAQLPELLVPHRRRVRPAVVLVELGECLVL